METGDGLTLESIVGGAGFEEDVVERETLRAAIESLPERERKVILLRYFRSYTQHPPPGCWGIPRRKSPGLKRRLWKSCAAC